MYLGLRLRREGLLSRCVRWWQSELARPALRDAAQVQSVQRARTNELAYELVLARPDLIGVAGVGDDDMQAVRQMACRLLAPAGSGHRVRIARD